MSVYVNFPMISLLHSASCSERGRSIVGSGTFDQASVDVQATPVEPMAPEAFDFDAYADYESSLLQRCRAFWAASSGVLVYRRMRVAEVYSHGCQDMKRSLELQLGALHKSMEFKADAPNFLEPWYGIGTVASAFGIDYVWKQGQPPVVQPRFRSVRDATRYETTPVAQTTIGKRTLEMIDYFLERTHARLPSAQPSRSAAPCFTPAVIGPAKSTLLGTSTLCAWSMEHFPRRPTHRRIRRSRLPRPSPIPASWLTRGLWAARKPSPTSSGDFGGRE